jgi:exopolyphosphatase/guanosine-5'-triphosphate,3'-diphosphate pyrophosphatase
MGPEADQLIVPRWEWRTFGEQFAAAEDRFASESPESVGESDELYILSASGDDTVKVRAGLMDVKHLELVNDDGLEQWKPILKAEFPLPADDVRAVLKTLGTTGPPLGREAYSVDELLDEVVRPDAGLRAAQVHKRRVHYLLDGCMAELTEVSSDGSATRTIAVESEDPELVIATVRSLGLESLQNTNFPRGLKTLLGFAKQRYAVIDVGTNSVKFHVADRLEGGVWRPVADRADVTRLGQGLEETGRLDPEAMQRTIAAIGGMVDEARRDGAEAITVVGTAGLRIAANSAEFVEQLQAATGVKLEVISGEDEGRLAYLAAEAGLGLSQESVAVFDTGGGSSQFTFGRGEEVDERFSVNVGAVRFTERFGLAGPVSEDVLASALEAIGADLSRLDGRQVPDRIVGLGGAVTNLAAVMHQLETYDPDVVQGSTLDRSEIDSQIELYRTRSADERRSIVGLQPNRAEVILAGACIVKTILAKLGGESFTVSDRGLRHGVLVDRFAARR